MHCQKFCWGVDKIIFDIARKMVLEDNFHPDHYMDKFEYEKDTESLEYYNDSQTSESSRIVARVCFLYNSMKNGGPK